MILNSFETIVVSCGCVEILDANICRGSESDYWRSDGSRDQRLFDVIFST